MAFKSLATLSLGLLKRGLKKTLATLSLGLLRTESTVVEPEKEPGGGYLSWRPGESIPDKDENTRLLNNNIAILLSID